MNEQSKSSDTYGLQRVIFFGAAGSFGFIAGLVSLIFLASQLTRHHPIYISGTVNEMVSYSEFLLFAFASYFISALAVRYFQAIFSQYGPSWVFISFVGSLIFSFSYFTKIWLLSQIGHAGDTLNAPASYWYALGFMFVLSLILTAVTGTFSAIASVLYERYQNRNTPPVLIK